MCFSDRTRTTKLFFVASVSDGPDTAGASEVRGSHTVYTVSGVKTEEIRKGRILAGLRDIWRVFWENGGNGSYKPPGAS